MQVPYGARVPSSRCPYCKKSLDGARIACETSQAERPNPGDYSMCINCGSFNVFGKDLRLRKPTEAETAEIGTDPDAMRLMAKFRITNGMRSN